MSEPIFKPDEIVPSRVDLGEQERRIDEQERITRAKIVEGVILVKTDPNRKIETTYPDHAEPYPGAKGPDPIIWKKPKKKRKAKPVNTLIVYSRGMTDGLSVAIGVVTDQLLETCERVEKNPIESTEGILELARIRKELKSIHETWRKKADA